WLLVTDELPQASTASHVLVVVFEHELPPVTSPRFTTVAPLHASDAVGGVNEGVAVHSIVVFAPALPISGAVVSTCVMVWLRVAEEFPQASTASHVLVVVFSQEVPPVTSPPTCTTVDVLHASLAVGAVNEGAVEHSIVAFAPAFPIVGACVSTCVMVWLRVTEGFPQASTASHVLVVVFSQELPPVTSPRFTTVAPLHASDAVGGVNEGVAVHSI